MCSSDLVNVDAVFNEVFKPTYGFVAEAHLELQQFTVVVPVGDGAGVVDADDEQAGGDGVSAWLAIVQRNVGRPFCTVVIVEGLSELRSSEASASGASSGRIGRIGGLNVHDEA